MVFDYYHRLNRTDQRIYRDSDKVETIVLPDPTLLAQYIAELTDALAGDDRAATERSCRAIADTITKQLEVPAVRVKVLAVRPHNDYGELHGDYTLPEDGEPAHIRLWMRTARRKQVVAFRTFLRTLLHELCHHLDYAHLRLADSFHTEGFYKRESGLFRQIVPDAAKPTARR